MSDNPVRVAIVGCGAVSQILYAPALQSLEEAGEAKVAALVDPAAAQRDELRRSFPHALTYADFTQCPLDEHGLVIVASPPKLHEAHSVHALRQGVPVLCEKPMASSSAEAEAMLGAARQSGVPLAVGHFRRFFPASEMLKEIFARRPFGPLRHFSIQEGGKFAWGVASPALFKREFTPGGVLYDSGVHVVDLLLWWLGEPAEFSYQDDAMGGIEANCLLEMSYAGGVRGTIRLSRDWPTRNRYLFVFENGAVTYEVGQANRLSLSVEGLPFALGGDLLRPAARDGIVGLPTRTASQSFTEQLRNVLAAVRGRQPLRVPGEEGIRSLRFIEDCYRRRTLMEMPWLTGEERLAAEGLSLGGL
jgi:predicted dehydrogenase